MAIDHGHVDSMFKYAMMLDMGDGISKDQTLAAKYFKMATDRICENSIMATNCYCKSGTIDSSKFFGQII